MDNEIFSIWCFPKREVFILYLLFGVVAAKVWLISVVFRELILINSHISAYKQASYSNHNPTDERKLLLNKKEINKLIGKMQRDGFTIVPTKMYFKKGKAKIELAVAKGKKQFDKRATKKNRDWNREKARYIRKSS